MARRWPPRSALPETNFLPDQTAHCRPERLRSSGSRDLAPGCRHSLLMLLQYLSSVLLILRSASLLREQSARPGLNEKDQRDENENFRQHGTGVGLQQFVDGPHRHATDE